MTLLPLPFIFFLLTSLPFSVISQLDERSTLLNLKRSLGDPPSLRLWNNTSSPCDWSEITCVAGNVTGISLKNQIIITARVPTNICDFPNLETLDLSSNRFSEHFPTVLYNCTKLRHLDLSQNYFNGTLPADIDRLSRQLEILDLSSNAFSGKIPPEIGNLKFKTLNLSSNMLSGELPDQLDSLAYETSFLNNTNLCADTPVVKLQDCRKVPRRSKGLPGPIFVMILVIGGLILAAALVLTFVAVRRKPRTRGAQENKVLLKQVWENISTVGVDAVVVGW
ncbi:Leucine-rich repeat-containing protein [Hirschfeldia incana]|nr:Leucine-rich repeat-containing protein [Hirschfeldia incana]